MNKLILFLCALPLALNAATLTMVPMQGGMAMPEISYSNSTQRVHVSMPVEIPQLTPLLVSNPADNFDPLDPWFQDLDPSREGESFSMRYGFTTSMGPTDPLPANTAYWIRKISSSPELHFYRYKSSAPKAWEPIFGTDGSTNQMFWNKMMFHPAVTAPPGTNNLSATFEVFLMDTLLTQEVANSSSGPLVFNFTNVNDGRPDLGLSLVFALNWSTNATNWVVESASSITATNWTAVTNVPALIDGSSAVLLNSSEAGKVYRMRRNP